MNNWDWKNSECKNGWLHRFQLVNQWNDCVEEVCEICGKSAYFEIIDGRIDNDKYIAFHNRQILQPNDPRFQREYGI